LKESIMEPKKAEGVVRELAGNVQETIGAVAGDPEMELRGKAGELRGKAQQICGDATELARDAMASNAPQVVSERAQFAFCSRRNRSAHSSR
jgi:uncharacterized protein YjbJ (UPF0337 family)